MTSPPRRSRSEALPHPHVVGDPPRWRTEDHARDPSLPSTIGGRPRVGPRVQGTLGRILPFRPACAAGIDWVEGRQVRGQQHSAFTAPPMSTFSMPTLERVTRNGAEQRTHVAYANPHTGWARSRPRAAWSLTRATPSGPLHPADPPSGERGCSSDCPSVTMTCTSSRPVLRPRFPRACRTSSSRRGGPAAGRCPPGGRTAAPSGNLLRHAPCAMLPVQGALQRERSVPGRDVTRSSARIAASRGGRSRVGPGQSSRYVPTMLRAPPSAPGASWAGLTVVESSRDHSSTGGPARYSCTAKIAIAPSPAAEATRFTERWRTSPIANTPGMLVSMA